MAKEETRSQKKELLVGMLCLTLLAVATSAPTAEKEEEVNNGQDPTKPPTRFDLRYQYQNLPPSSNDDAHIITLRADKPFILAPGWSLASHIDAPES